MSVIHNLNPILIADDDLDDCMLTRRALEKGRVANPLHEVYNGEELLDYLKRRGKYTNPEDAPRPELILVDLNMPRMNGYEAIEAIKANADLRSIPIVVLTTSDQEEDICKAYKLDVSGYIVKPVNLDGLVRAMSMLGDYWFRLVKLP